VVFGCEDDLWAVSVSGGVARRLTSGLGQASRPRLSPDGSLLAFTSDDEGTAEVWVMPSEGGAPRRLTWLGDQALVLGWTPDGRIVFTTMARSPFFRDYRLFALSPDGGEPERLPWGLGTGIAFGDSGAVAICWHAEDIAWWKRYRGGRVGVLHVDPTGDGDFHKPLDLDTQACCPMWLGDRLAFISDHEGVGQLYACGADGADLERLTPDGEHYVRWAANDGDRVVYIRGGDLRLLDLGRGEDRRIDVELRSPATMLRRRYVDVPRFVESVDLHPDGRSLAIVVRGKPVVLGSWEGPAVQLGDARDGSVRYREARWLDDEQILVLSDADGEETFEVRPADGSGTVRRLEGLDVGRPHEVVVAPSGTRFAFANHRYEVGVVDLVEGGLRIVGRSEFGRCADLAWSPDGGWLAWTSPEAAESRSQIRLWGAESDQVTDLTDGRYLDRSPCWDPEGKTLYFLSAREFDPVYDHVYFDLGFTWSMRPYAVTLQADEPSPFMPRPRPLRPPEPEPPADDAEIVPVRVELEGLSDRLVALPVDQARYHRIAAAKGKVLMSIEPVEGSRALTWHSDAPAPANKPLRVWDFETQSLETLEPGVSDFAVSRNGRAMLLHFGRTLRIKPVPSKAPAKPPAEPPDASPGRKTGWVDLGRVSVSVDPRAEWGQMFAETWRLMREHFWNPEMSGVDWDAAWDRYAPLLDRVASRSEYSDLVWCMVGETGTSHCYEMMGEYRPHPSWNVGRLGAELSWSGEEQGYRVDRVVRGEPGDPQRSSPLLAPGVGVAEGDVLVEVDGVRLSPTEPPGRALVDKAGRQVSLVVRSGDDSRRLTVRPLKEAMPLYYRDWVLRNQRRVHAETDGRVGYVHIPDMGPMGFGEFHRDYLAEADREALIVDVRFNRGGHVSQLLIEKLARRIVGWDNNRWGQPWSYPAHAPRGPMVALTNGFAGSDGDIFSHVWKLNDLGPLLGERTWGGVVGIWPRFRHVDGSITTQPEFAFWFEDVGYGVENHGTDPDEVVPLGPADYAAGRDPQLAAGLERVLGMLEAGSFGVPDFGPAPPKGA